MKDKKQKINNGCINIFRFLQLLYDDEAYYDDVVSIYKDDINEKSENNLQVVLNKVINAMKIFGIKVEKVKNKYELKNSLYTANYDVDDLKSISILIKAVENYPNKTIKKQADKILKLFTLRMSSDCLMKLNQLSTNYNFNFFYKPFKQQIEDCQELCKTELLFNIKYLYKGKEVQRQGIAKDVTFTAKTAYLQMYDTDNNLNFEIPIPNILDIKQQNSKNRKMIAPLHTTFYLKGRLAKTYKLKENEQLQEKECTEDKISILSKTEPLDVLLPRLMRYQDNCVVKGPQYVREEMLKMINDTLEQYGES